MSLLAVDLGLRAGFACYGRDGALRWYRSQHFSDAKALLRAVGHILRQEEEAGEAVAWLILEGDRLMAEPIQAMATRRGVRSRRINAEKWRPSLLLPRQQRHGRDAKKHADALARRTIEASGAKRPTSLRHDAAEAILIGLWGVIEVGWRGPMRP